MGHMHYFTKDTVVLLTTLVLSPCFVAVQQDGKWYTTYDWNNGVPQYVATITEMDENACPCIALKRRLLHILQKEGKVRSKK